jgi:hypothetical protein
VNDYWQNMKIMANTLCELGEPVADRTTEVEQEVRPPEDLLAALVTTPWQRSRMLQLWRWYDHGRQYDYTDLWLEQGQCSLTIILEPLD